MLLLNEVYKEVYARSRHLRDNIPLQPERDTPAHLISSFTISNSIIIASNYCTMSKSEEAVTTHHDSKDGPTTAAIQQEHDLTIRDVLSNHRTLVWWCFYWAMCAVGWYVGLDPNDCGRG
jgi:hypothetical protein